MKFLIGFLMLFPVASFASSASLTQEASKLTLSVGPLAPPVDYDYSHGSYFNWGRGQNGWGYCYEWTYDGYVLNEGRPVNTSFCERVSPSMAVWNRAQNGWGYCYRITSNGFTLNDGRPIDPSYCEATGASYYRWGRANDGYVRCYKFSFNGLILNEGRPVENYYCR